MSNALIWKPCRGRSCCQHLKIISRCFLSGFFTHFLVVLDPPPQPTCRTEQTFYGKTLAPFHHFSLHLTHNNPPESFMCARVVCVFESFKWLFSSADLRYLQPPKLYMNCHLNNKCRACVFANICPLDVAIFGFFLMYVK